jgi:UDP-N-acetylmuramoyl-tripeptide--D-alanyl-D-alanine ligase
MRAAAVGLVEGLSWQEILAGLRHGNTQLRLVAVRSQTGALLLDDTYNASPESMLAALNLLSEVGGKRKVAVLGDMLELGPYEERAHNMVGMRAAQIADTLITLGARGRMYAQAARRAGMQPSHVFEFEDRGDVVSWLGQNLTETDVVLIKGSHGLRMDLIVGALEQGS